MSLLVWLVLLASTLAAAGAGMAAGAPCWLLNKQSGLMTAEPACWQSYLVAAFVAQQHGQNKALAALPDYFEPSPTGRTNL